MYIYVSIRLMMCSFHNVVLWLRNIYYHTVNNALKKPELQLVWSVSRRTLMKLKPSQRVLLDLYTIMEDEVDDFNDIVSGTDSNDDAAPFDR